MVVEKLVTAFVKTEIEITDITLLSVEDYEAAMVHIPPVDDWWWLRTPGDFCNRAACVDELAYIRVGFCVYFDIGVRPALRVNPQSLNLQIREKVRFNGRIWTYVAEGILLCDEIICKMPFREDWQAEDANDYEASDVKKFVESWFAAAKITAQP